MVKSDLHSKNNLKGEYIQQEEIQALLSAGAICIQMSEVLLFTIPSVAGFRKRGTVLVYALSINKEVLS